VPIGGDDHPDYAPGCMKRDSGMWRAQEMETNVYGTDYCIGFRRRHAQRGVHPQTAEPARQPRAHRVVELFGRNSGETSLIASYSRAWIEPSLRGPVRAAPASGTLMQDKKKNPSNYAMVTISEGATMLGGDIIEAGRKMRTVTRNSAHRRAHRRGPEEAHGRGHPVTSLSATSCAPAPQTAWT